jgi:putative phosphoribosyl transferase
VRGDDVRATSAHELNARQGLKIQIAPPPGTSRVSADTGADGEIEIVVGPVRLSGQLTWPRGARGTVIFAHGSGSGRHSPRNLFVSGALNHAGFGTLLFDLLTTDEEIDRNNVFNVKLLADRLVAATHWLRDKSGIVDAQTAPIGYFGASTGAAAALCAAAELGREIGAVVSRGGRPDLAGHRLPEVTAPTLLIVGGYDDIVLELNREAHSLMRCRSRLCVVPGATHLFDEAGALEAVADLARDWFLQHLTSTAQPTANA